MAAASEIISIPNVDEAELNRAQHILAMAAQITGWQPHPTLPYCWVFALGAGFVQLALAHDSTGRDLHMPRDYRGQPRALGKAKLIATDPLTSQELNLDEIEGTLKHLLAERAASAEPTRSKAARAPQPAQPQMVDVLLDISATLRRIECLIESAVPALEPAQPQADADASAA